MPQSPSASSRLRCNILAVAITRGLRKAKRGVTAIVAAAAVLCGVQAASAHTVSYGYVAGTQPGTYTFWFGTYHLPAAANYTEGSLQLTCGGGFSSTVSFSATPNLVYAKPAGLVNGTNYFYDAGYGGEAGSPLFAVTPTHTAGTLTGPVAAWQGVTFTNITYPGTCTFKYIAAVPATAVWDPNGANGTLVGIGSGSFVLTEGITITKTSPSTSFATVGQIISYSYAVKNTGNMVLTAPLSIADNKTAVSCPAFGPLAGTSPVVNGLATGATITCTATYNVTQADIDAGSLTNTAKATSGTSTTPYTSPAASLTIPAAQSPAMTVLKSSTVANFNAPGVLIPYSYVVKNTGNTTLNTTAANSITISDNKIATAAITCPATALPPGQSFTCTGTYTTTQADIDANGVTNTASSKSGTASSPTVSLTVPSVQSPSLKIAKSTTATGFSVLGASIPYSYVVTNNGNTTLTSAISVADSKIASVSCPALPSGGLVPNATLTCSATYIVTQADLDAGTLTNIATAASGSITSPQSSVTLTGTKSPSITIAKNTTASTYSSVGTSIPYTFTVKNTGNVTLAGPFTVSDPKIASVSCPALAAPGLAPLATTVCTGSYVITQADIDAGSVLNTATASTTGPTGPISSPPGSHTLNGSQTHTLSLAKSASLPAGATTFAAPGVAVTYTYTVTNTGNITIPATATMKITDNKLGALSCPAIPAGGLAPAATLICTASYTTTQADVDAGSINNLATATDGTVTSPQAGATVNAAQTSALAVAKSTVPANATYANVGDTLTYNFVVTNTGNTTATAAITVTDSKISTVSCPALPSGGLAPAATLTCTATYTITQADLDAGGVTNSAFAKSGTTTSTPPVTHTSSGTQSPALGVVKNSTSANFSAAGVSIPYTYTVTNTGNVTITAGINVTDNKIASVSCPSIGAGLAPGKSIVCSANYTTTQADVDAGGVTNIATAATTFTPMSTGVPVVVTSPTGTKTVPSVQTFSMAVTKTPGTSTYSTAGAVIGYTYKVTNTGNSTLVSAISITDNKIVAPNAVSCPAVGAGLAPAASMTCTASYTVTQADIDAGTIVNTASAASGATTSPPVSATVTANKSSALSVAKTSATSVFNAANVSITYNYLVTNTGNTTLKTAITIADNKIIAPNSVSCSPVGAGLAPGASISCSATYVTTQADIDAGGITNTASASSGATASPVTSLTINAGRTYGLSVAKSTGAITTYSTVGTVIPYTFTVTNTGNTTVTQPVSITDSKISSVVCPPVGAGVAPGNSITCSANYTITQADIDSGNVVNAATATSGTITSPTVSHTLPGTQSPKLTVAKTAATPAYPQLPSFPSSLTYAKPGDTINYSYVITNAGNVSLTAAVVLSDNKIPGPYSCTGPNPPAAGASITCTATYTVTQPDIDAGNVLNTAFATSSTLAGPLTSATASATVTASQKPAVSVAKSVVAPTPAVLNTVGQTITYNYLVTNSGNTTLTTPVTVSDNKIAAVTCNAMPSGGLAPGNTLLCTATYKITQADLDAGSVSNTATGQSGPTVSTPPTTITHPLNPAPAMTMAKSASVASFTNAGTVINYAYIITNSGNTTITTPVSVTDNKIVAPNAVVCPALPSGGLAPSATLTCTASYTTTQADVDSGGVTNSAKATSGTVPPATASITVTATPGGGLSVSKSTVQSTFNAINQTINYNFLVTNTGNLTLNGPFKVTDGKVPNATCPATPATLQPQATVTCSGTYTTTQADLDAGSVLNSATVSGTSPSGGTVTSPPGTNKLPATQTRALSVAKSAAPLTFNAANVSITYTYTVTNTGNITITAPATISISDNKIASVNCNALPSGGLAPLATLTCSAIYKTTQADVDTGSVINTATATDGIATSPPVSATINAVQNAAITVKKTPVESSFKAAGDIIHYTYLVTNTGNVTEPAVFTITDNKIASVSCPALTAGQLAPGGTLTCTAQYTVTQADLDAGGVTNSAFARSGPTVSTPPVVVTVPAAQAKSLSIAKTSTATTYSKAGDILPYTYVVTNTGNVTLTSNITVADSKISTVTCPALPAAGLAPAQSITCTANYTITQADVDAGTVSNDATASSGSTTSPKVTLPIKGTQTSSMKIAKLSTASGYSTLGTVVPYTYVVTNTGNTTITAAITVSDNKITTVSCPALPAGGLAPAAFITCSASYTVTQADLDAGTLANTASAKSGALVSPPVTYTITGTQTPALTVAKTSTSSTFSKAGDIIAYSYKVTNTGNVTLASQITIADSKIAAVVCPALTAPGLAPGATLVCTANYTVTQADLDAGGVTNSASATSGKTTSPGVSLTITATQAPALSIVKSSTTAGLLSAGQVVPYSYKVTNSGNITLKAAVTVSDNKIAAVTCPVLAASGLAPGASITCTGSYTVTQADLDAGGVTNLASAASGGVASPQTSLKIVAIHAPSLGFVKSANIKQFTAVGQSIVYTFTITNTGNVTFTNSLGIKDILTTEDVGCPIPDPPPGGLKPGQTFVCTATYVVTQADMDAGTITNTAFAVTIDPATGVAVQSKPSTVVIPGLQNRNFTVAKATTTPQAINNGDGSFTSKFIVTIVNTGNVTLNALQVSDNYQSGLPSGARVTAASVQSVTSSARAVTGTQNSSYDATASKPNLIAAQGETIAPGESVVVAFTIGFDPGLNQSSAAFNNTATATAVFPNGTPSGVQVSKSGTATVTFTPNHPLIVTKTAAKTEISRGDLVPYTITVVNNYDPQINNVTLVDFIPAGFKYKAGSATINGARLEPAVAGQQLSWGGQTAAKGKPLVLKLMLVAGAGLGNGDFTNQAYVATYGEPISNTATATVRIIPDPTFDCTDIIGRVFDDANQNGYPDEGERGIANVRVVTVTGQLITTDADGRFHIACADAPDQLRGSNFILKLDERTLPTGYRVTTENPRVIRITAGKMAKINFGAALSGVARVDLAEPAFEPGTVNLTQKWFDALPQVFEKLREQKAILRLAYRRSAEEDVTLARARVHALQKYMLETWRSEGAGYELTIETEVYFEQSGQK